MGYVSPVRVAIAGSTGSIGTQTLDVVRAEHGAYEVVGLGVGSSVEAVVAQAREFRPKVVAVADPDARARVAAALPGVEVVADMADLVDVADVVVNAVVGFAGLPVTVAHAARRQASRARQQGEPHRRRSGGAAAARDARRRAGPGRQRALRGPPVPAVVGRTSEREVARIVAHRERRTVPRPDVPTSSPTSASTTRSLIRHGRWDRRSPSTPRR